MGLTLDCPKFIDMIIWEEFHLVKALGLGGAFGFGGELALSNPSSP